MTRRIIYLHGFASGPSSKKAQLFGDRFRQAGIEVEVPDLAEGNFEGLTITGQLRVIERLAAGQPVSLMGSSMGGYLAALYGARRPEVERMLLMAPAFGFARRWAASLGPGQLERWRETGCLEVYHYAEGRQRRIGYGLLEDAFAYEDYPAITQPALIYHGIHDTVVPHEFSREFARLRPNVRLELVDSDHELLTAVEQIWEGARVFFGSRE